MIEVIKCGVLTTLQDLGRPGFRYLGISHAGALDTVALSIANRLVNNPIHYVGVEITLGPVEFLFTINTSIALTGADFESSLDNMPVWPGWRIPVRAGQRLKLNAAKDGMRAYLAVSGGINVELVLGSRSTDLKSGFGGWQGRALQVGDRIPLACSDMLTKRIGLKLPEWTSKIRAIPGPEYNQFAEQEQQQFWRTEWKITPESNRMGYRLLGKQLLHNEQLDKLSHGVIPGIVQVPPNGQPIVLLADAQTTGGYPRIAVVIKADLWKIAQARLGASLRFELCNHKQAQIAHKELALYMNKIVCGLGL
ncbi:MAG: biotin-dependent carboxyltransferase family protein [Pseudomonadota bacterium]